MDVKKHMTSKYGKEFVSAAVELRPDCGVNRMVSFSTCLKLDRIRLKLISNLVLYFQLVEKLSAKAPDGPTKIKILTAIAEEHNIKWEPKSFGETDVKSSQDLLVGLSHCAFSLVYFDIICLLDYIILTLYICVCVKVGPSTYENAAYSEPSQIHVPPVHDEKAPNLHASSQHKPLRHACTNSYEQTASSTARKDQSTTSGVSNPEIRSSGIFAKMVLTSEFLHYCCVYYLNNVWDSFLQELEVK